MLLFQPTPSTPYDVRFNLFGIPVRVSPTFWLIAILFGISGSLWLLPVWVFVIFISILIHELGHALAFRRYGQRSEIVLHFAGGLTIPQQISWGNSWASVALSYWQEVFIALAGPVTGFLFAGVIIFLVKIIGGSILTSWLLGFIPLPVMAVLPFGGSLLATFITMLLWVNLFWGLINLMPVFPLDGGNVARNLFLQYDRRDGMRKSLWLSVIVGALVALIGLIAFRSLYMALLFGLLAYQSYQAVQGRYGGY